MILKTITFLLLFTFLGPAIGRAELNDDVLEKKIKQLEQETLEKEMAQKMDEEKKKRFNSSIGLEAIYETNPRLSSSGKGDKSGRLKFSTAYKRPLAKRFMLNVNYDFDGTLYTDFTDLTNILNHGRLSLDRSLNKYFTAGAGYDLSVFYYPKEQDSDYYFQKGFVYVKHHISKKFYHQVTWEEGVKNYINAKPYLDSTTTYLDKHRRDYRHALEYSVGLLASKNVSLRIRAKYSINDANALFQDYHDYTSMDITPSINYKITDRLAMNMSITYSDKDYAERLVGSSTYTRGDKTYSPTVGFRYNLTKSQTIMLGYAYTENVSNDPTGEYLSSTVNCGWQYGF